ncbi:Vi polysaccharide biosynthesis UDP-N-acetylglucosamine C-6 dehydrogenase TviB [Halomonas litopenaei]|uniref:Vi polysaccharide biosynthesis UDP-N-acetylglucosamine C-6 dehydrogenase TviB n=1 Tax=Halomonas litopenaei TaxID=2109328 RepID=UPI003F9FCC45
MEHSLTLDKARIAVIGLGYVGLPLAVEFGKRYPTLGFDISAERIAQLHDGIDTTREVTPGELGLAPLLSFTYQPTRLADANVYIVTVPTPIDAQHNPDLTPLLGASATVGRVIAKGDIVIFESTVYPGATEDECIPVIEQLSGLRYNRDFFAGYSPERINPGDREHRVTTIRKVTSGSTPASADFVDALYASVITAGTFRASSITVAEAAKVIENTQRDVNIALINELSIIFERLGIDTEEVLEAAGTKWNFLPFRPGLVGGHCIGVDPYYLTHKAQQVGYHPEVILSGRRINDGMGAYVANQLIKCLAKRRIHVQDARVLIMGLTFKENCPDLRNTRVIDIIDELREFNVAVDVLDPHVDRDEAVTAFGLRPVDEPEPGAYDAVIIAVAHHEFHDIGVERIRGWGKPEHVLYDLKYLLPKGSADLRL